MIMSQVEKQNNKNSLNFPFPGWAAFTGSKGVLSVNRGISRIERRY